MIEAPVISRMENVLAIRDFTGLIANLRNVRMIVMGKEIAIRKREFALVKKDGKEMIAL